ncbi:MAG: pentapeptide repeat-containing protein [Paracoccaceae bacterium]
MTDDANTPEKPALKDASTNPWYVLMTVAGEQPDEGRPWAYDEDLHARNRRYFNGWMAQSLSEGAKQKLIAEERATAEDLADLTDEETAAIAQAFAYRCPNAEPLDATHPRCSLKGIESTARVVCVGFVFSGVANFRDATFSRYADFSDATFSGDADFSDAKFKSKTVFANVTFQPPRASPPQFYNAELHEDTSWERITTWPLPGPGHDASDFVRAYEKLKLLMDDKNKLYSEHMFHRLELQSRQIAEPNTLATRASRLFGWVSDYGWSISRPATGLFVLALFGWMVIFLNQALTYGADVICKTVDGQTVPGALMPLESVKLSISNIFGFLGFARTFMRDTLGCLTPLSEIVSMAQSFLGVIFLFLMVLALRNRFRIK